MTDGVAIKVDMSDVSKLFQDVAARLGSDRPLQLAADIVTQSVKYNFVAGGRPTPWEPPKYRKGQPLRDKGQLINSISGQVSGNKGIVSTSVVYAGTHNFGAKKGSYGKHAVTVQEHSRKRGGTTYKVKSHKRMQSLPWGNIPKREFMLYHDADVLEIERQLKRLAEG